jgi:hypothetical protein
VAVPEFVSTGGKSAAAVIVGDAEFAHMAAINIAAKVVKEIVYVSTVGKSVLVESVVVLASVGTDAGRHDVNNAMAAIPRFINNQQQRRN